MGRDTLFQCPIDCIAGVGEVWSGQYDFPVNITGVPLILDIGANVGAFALWASQRWPESQLRCFEPHPEIFQYLRRNTAHLPQVDCFEGAVGDQARRALRPGNNTRLCSSLYDIGRQGNASMIVKIVHPRDLPNADIIKIDCEGSEAFILENMVYVPELLVVEFHSERLRQRCEAALAGKMQLLSCEVLQPGWGHMKFMRKEVIA